MDKELVYLITWLVTWSDFKSKEVVRIIFTNEKELRNVPTIKLETTKTVEFKGSVKSKKEELQEALSVLKSKKNKTVKDKNSIGVLESVLNNYR
jgi:hypothetical protein